MSRTFFSYPLLVRTLTVSAIFLLGPALLHAQELPPQDPLEDASVVERRIRQEAEGKLEEKREAPKIKEEKPKKKPPEQAELRFLVKDIRLEGNRLLTERDLEGVIRPFEGREQTISGLEELTKAIEDTYRARGYVTGIAYIPPQKIEKGVLAIHVIEGRLGKLFVEGNRHFTTKRILRYALLDKGDPLYYPKLRKMTRRLNLNPDRTVQAILREGVEAETTDIVFKVKDRFTVHPSFLFDNEGTRTTGRQRFGFSLVDNNFLKRDQTATTGTVFGKDVGALFVQWAVPLARYGTKLVSGFTHTQVSPKKELKGFGVNGLSDTYFGRVEQEIFESERVIAYFDAGFDIKESRTRVLSGSHRRDRLRVIRFGPRLIQTDRRGVTQLTHQWSFGVKGLGAAVHLDDSIQRQEIHPDFFTAKVNFLRAQRLPWGTRLNLRADVQIPSGKVPSSEAMQLGGGSSVRGYPEGDFLADLGFLVTTEWLVPCFLIPTDWQLPRSATPLRKQIEFVTFFDQGHARVRGPAPGDLHRRRLLGIGGGLRIRLWRNLYARTDWAHALDNEPLTESDHTRFHFRLQAEI